MFLSWVRPRSVTARSSRPLTCQYACSDRQIAPGLAMPSSRAAIMTPSPIRSPSASSTTSPRWMPGDLGGLRSFATFSEWRAWVLRFSVHPAVPLIVSTKFERAQKLYVLAWRGRSRPPGRPPCARAVTGASPGGRGSRAANTIARPSLPSWRRQPSRFARDRAASGVMPSRSPASAYVSQAPLSSFICRTPGRDPGHRPYSIAVNDRLRFTFQEALTALEATIEAARDAGPAAKTDKLSDLPIDASALYLLSSHCPKRMSLFGHAAHDR